MKDLPKDHLGRERNAMKTRKLYFCVLILITLLGLGILGTIGVSASSEKIRVTNFHGFTFSFDPSTSTMTVTGEGTISLHYGNSILSPFTPTNPWRKENVKHLVIESGITGFGDKFFSEMPELETVKISESITYLEGAFLFKDCLKLKTIYWSDSFLAISRGMFQGYVALEIDEDFFPKTLATIGAYAFDGCSSLRNIVLQEGVLAIYDYVLSNTGIETINLPASLYRILPSFLSSPNLTSEGVFFDETNPYYTFQNGCLIAKNPVNYISDFRTGDLIWGDVADVIPEGVTRIFTGSFSRYAKIKNVVLPSTLTLVQDNAFAELQIESLYIPSTLAHIPPLGSLFLRSTHEDRSRRRTSEAFRRARISLP